MQTSFFFLLYSPSSFFGIVFKSGLPCTVGASHRHTSPRRCYISGCNCVQLFLNFLAMPVGAPAVRCSLSSFRDYVVFGVEKTWLQAGLASRSGTAFSQPATALLAQTALGDGWLICGSHLQGSKAQEISIYLQNGSWDSMPRLRCPELLCWESQSVSEQRAHQHGHNSCSAASAPVDEAMRLGGAGQGAGCEAGLQLLSCTPVARCQGSTLSIPLNQECNPVWICVRDGQT